MPTRFPAYPSLTSSHDSPRGFRQCDASPRSVPSRRSRQRGSAESPLLGVALLVAMALAMLVTWAAELELRQPAPTPRHGVSR
jgi:hypothetical protein